MSKDSIMGMYISILISTPIFVFSFATPFRKPSQPLVSSGLADRIEQRQAAAGEVRALAHALNNTFMQEVAEQRQRKSVPGIREAKQRWSQRALKVKMQVAQLKGARKGSLEWLEREELLKSLEDGPK